MRTLPCVRRSVNIAGLGVAVVVLVSCQQHTGNAPVNVPAAATPPIVNTPTSEASPLRLGTISFPTSGAPDAQPHFIYGVAALHSFWYEEALEAFARAAQIDPGFAMAYWGEAMCYHRTFRPGADAEAGRRALKKIKDTQNLTDREKRYISAARTLFGSSGAVNVRQYAEEMERLQKSFPNDQEAAAFHALARLATGREDKEQAGRIAEAVYRQNPNHPGAAHYIIHAYDAPESASRALDAAHHYSKIAPDAPHALHMPSHIFVQLGMWREAHMSNDLGWAASVDYVKRKSLTPTLRDYHNLHWLIYAALQEGRYAKAGTLMREFVRMRSNGELASYGKRYFDGALSAYLIETRRWDEAESLISAPQSTLASTTATRNGASGGVELCGAAPAPAEKSVSGSMKGTSNDAPTFLRAFAATVSRRPSPVGSSVRFSNIRELQLKGVARAEAGDFKAALAALREAATIEGKTGRPPGPPGDKPAHELLGEVLLKAGQPKEAIAQFKIALERHPNRALSLLGRARAEAAAGDLKAAHESYSRLLQFWQQADANLPELLEARQFVASRVAASD